MSLNSINNRRSQKKFVVNEEYYSSSTNDRNTLSTFEKERNTKNKAVTFGTISIIEVESYKKYNKIQIFTFESIEFTCLKACDECRCTIF